MSIRENNKLSGFIHNYRNELISQIGLMSEDVLMQIVKEIDQRDGDGSDVYVIGNGGSATTASHMQNDLGAGLKRRGVLNLNITSLCDNISVLTALSNDIGYDNIFYSQLHDKIKEDDLLIAFSCSGNSKNITKAAEYSRGLGATVIGVTGFDGGLLKELSDINYHVHTEQDKYGIVEDMHMIMNHMLYTYFLERFRSNG